jgi:mannitol-specific phosphotransferase system IIBC component
MKKTIIFQIDGGLGKSIMGPAVLSALRKQYKNDYIIVVTGYPDVFIGNPNVNKILNQTQTNGIYKKHIMGKDSKVFVADPYNTNDYIKNT